MIIKGKDGTVSLTQGGVTINVACVSSFSVSVEADTLETTCMGNDGFKTFVGSLQSWSGSVDANLDSADAEIVSGSEIGVVLSDGTNTWTGSAIVTSKSFEVGVADLVTISLDLQGTGQLVQS